MKVLEKLYNGFIKFFGDIKVFKFPMFLVYDPGSYLVKGDDIREVLKMLKPGDILVRGYKNYLDGYFIPGFFSHAGLYLGKVAESDKKLIKKDAVKDFKAGEQIVIHSMAEGVFMEDVINFCRCDFMAVLRRNPKKESAAGKKHTFRKVFETALQNLGKEYDFKFDFSNFTKLSCTEFVYVACRDFMDDYNIKVRTEKVMFMKKRLISPDDYVKSKLDLVWKSKSISNEKIKKIKSGK